MKNVNTYIILYLFLDNYNLICHQAIYTYTLKKLYRENYLNPGNCINY